MPFSQVIESQGREYPLNLSGHELLLRLNLPTKAGILTCLKGSHWRGGSSHKCSIRIAGLKASCPESSAHPLMLWTWLTVQSTAPLCPGEEELLPKRPGRGWFNSRRPGARQQVAKEGYLWQVDWHGWAKLRCWGNWANGEGCMIGSSKMEESGLRPEEEIKGGLHRQ